MVLLMGPLLIVWLVCGIWLVSWCGISYRRETGNFWQGMLASALVFLLYFGNEVYAYSKWKVMCYTGASLKVYSAQAVKGFGVKSVYVSELRFYLESGYKFLEGMDGHSPGPEVYIFKGELGHVVKNVVQQRSSEYMYVTSRDDSSLVSQQTAAIIRIKDGFRMGELSNSGYKSGYVFQALKILLEVDATQGNAKWCKRGSSEYDLVLSVIPPLK